MNSNINNNFKNKESNTNINSVNVSDVELAMRVINGLPNVREEKVKEAKEKYSNPDYEEDAENVANKMLVDKIITYEVAEKFGLHEVLKSDDDNEVGRNE